MTVQYPPRAHFAVNEAVPGQPMTARVAACRDARNVDSGDRRECRVVIAEAYAARGEGRQLPYELMGQLAASVGRRIRRLLLVTFNPHCGA